MNEKNNNLKENVITRRIGSTTYKLKVFFSETAKETMEDKILRMIKNESLTNGEKCGDHARRTAFEISAWCFPPAFFHSL